MYKHKCEFLGIWSTQEQTSGIFLIWYWAWKVLPWVKGFTEALEHIWHNVPLARYVKLRVAHALGMPGTFSPPPRVSGPDMHQDTCVTYVPWCMPNVPGIPGACATHNFTYCMPNNGEKTSRFQRRVHKAPAQYELNKTLYKSNA